MTIALAPGRERERLAAPIAEEGDDAVGELTTSTASGGTASSQSMMRVSWPLIHSKRSHVAPSAAACR
jgi:hypothetical protein